MRFWLTLLACVFVGLIVAARSGKAATGQVETVPELDLKRYAGTWYEIARLPNRFQRECATDTMATYTLRPDGKVKVLNQCRTPEGKIKSAEGTAKRASESKPASRLRVTFFWPFYGDYWVIGLDPEYRWALVGDPGRKYLWVLSREPKMDDQTLEAILDRARQQGYELGSLLRTRQEVPVSGGL